MHNLVSFAFLSSIIVLKILMNLAEHIILIGEKYVMNISHYYLI